MSDTPQQKKLPVIWAGVLVVLLLAALVCWASFDPMALQDVRHITVAILHKNGQVNVLELDTTESALFDIQELADLTETDESTYGVYIKAMDGEDALTEEGEYWRYDLNGDWTDYAPEEQPIEDGDAFVFYITVLDV